MRTFGPGFTAAIAQSNTELFPTVRLIFPTRGTIYISQQNNKDGSPITIDGNAHRPIIVDKGWTQLSAIFTRDEKTLDIGSVTVTVDNMAVLPNGERISRWLSAKESMFVRATIYLNARPTTLITSAVSLSGSGVPLPVRSTVGFPASGTIHVTTNLGDTTASYTSIIDGTHFGGVTAVSSTTVVGGSVSEIYQEVLMEGVIRKRTGVTAASVKLEIRSYPDFRFSKNLLATWKKTQFPNLADGDDGKPIPRVYGYAIAVPMVRPFANENVSDFRPFAVQRRNTVAVAPSLTQGALTMSPNGNAMYINGGKDTISGGSGGGLSGDTVLSIRYFRPD